MAAKKKILSTPIVATQNATEVELLGFNYDAENNRLEVKYMLVLDDGTPYKRGRLIMREEAEIIAFFAGIKSSNKSALEAVEYQMLASIESKLDTQ